MHISVCLVLVLGVRQGELFDLKGFKSGSVVLDSSCSRPLATLLGTWLCLLAGNRRLPDLLPDRLTPLMPKPVSTGPVKRLRYRSLRCSFAAAAAAWRSGVDRGRFCRRAGSFWCKCLCGTCVDFDACDCHFLRLAVTRRSPTQSEA